MPKPKSKQSQVQSIVTSLETHLIKLRELAPAGFADKKDDDDEKLTWRMTVLKLEDALESADDLAVNLEFYKAAPKKDR